MVSRRRGHGEGPIYGRAEDGRWVVYITLGSESGEQVLFDLEEDRLA